MRTEGSEQLDLHNRSVGAYSRKHGTCFPSTITQHRFSNQEIININSNWGKTHGPFRLDIAKKLRAEISESFKNKAYKSKWLSVSSSFLFLWQAVRDVSSICNRSNTPFMYRRPDQSFFFILVEIHDLLPALYVFLLLASWNTFQSWFLKRVFITSQFRNKKWRIPKITKISDGSPTTIVCKLMNLTEAFLTENH